MAESGSGDSRRPSIELTEAPEFSGAGSPVRIASIDAEQVRNSVASRLFGAAADPVKIARFTVLKRLGAGGMGVVYSAYDDQIDRKIAIKLLRGIDQDAGPHRDRLVREAQALGKLSHPNVVTVFEVGTFRGQVFVAMEFIEGKTLREWTPDPPGDITQILDKFIQAGHGLAAAHAAGLVHRDFKPDNALVGSDGRVRVLDFGLARGIDEAPEVEPQRSVEGSPSTIESSNDSLRQPLTRTGAILGTPAYMAPEQHLGLRADARSDQFAFCVALWEKLYGERPFHGRDIRSLALAVTDGALQQPANNRTIPQWIRRALERGLSVAPERRFPDMAGLIAALTHDPRKRRRIWALVGGVGLASASVAIWLGTRNPGPDPCADDQRLAGVWDEDIRGQVRSAFEQTKVPYADEAWTETARLLDAYAEQWTTMDLEVCHARVAADQDAELVGRRMVCLGQRRTELEKLTELLIGADDDVVSRSVVAAGSLTQIATCADERALGPESGDPERLDELERLLASANGRKALGKYDEGLELARAAVTEARELDSARGEGRALLLLGDLQAKKQNLDDAKATLREALRRADVASDDATRVQALTQLMRVSYLEHDLEGGEVLAADARAALDRLGSAPLLEADFYLHYGSLALARGDDETAGEYHRRALTIREAQLGADHPEVAISMTNIANALIGEGNHAEAEELARRALAIFEKKLGVDHPYTAASHNNIGNSLLEQGRHRAWDDPEGAKPLFLKAAEHYLNAIAIREANLGPDHPSIALNLHNLGEARRHLGQWAEAKASYERSIAIKLRKHDPDHPAIIKSNTGLGRVLLELGEVDEALRVLEASANHIDDREVPAEDRGERAFALAKALTKQSEGSTGEAKLAAIERAHELATRAAAAFGEVGEEWAGELREVQEWLAQ